MVSLLSAGDIITAGSGTVSLERELHILHRYAVRASPTRRGEEASPVHGKNTEAAYELRTEAPDAPLGKLNAKECQRPRTAVPREIDPPAVRHCGPHPWMQAGLQLRIKYCY